MQKASLWQSETLYRILPMISKCVRTHLEAVKYERMYRDSKKNLNLHLLRNIYVHFENVKYIPVFPLFCEGHKLTQYFQLAQ